MRFIWATFLIVSTTVSWGQTSTKVYPSYTNTIFRKPFPDYLSEKKSDGSVWLYRAYTNTIFRKPFPEYIIQKDTVYRTYSNSIIRKPFPVGQIDEEAP